MPARNPLFSGNTGGARKEFGSNGPEHAHLTRPPNRGDSPAVGKWRELPATEKQADTACSENLLI